MDARQLKFFLAVVDQGGFNQRSGNIADRAALAVPVDIRIRTRTRGTALSPRRTRLVLSDAGETLVGPARVVLRDLEEAAAAMRS